VPLSLYGAVDTTKDTKITKEDIDGEADTETASAAEVCTQLVLIAQAKRHLVCARILRFLSYLRVLRDLRGDPTAVSRVKGTDRVRRYAVPEDAVDAAQ
jgi:hypothetical protein